MQDMFQFQRYVTDAMMHSFTCETIQAEFELPASLRIPVDMLPPGAAVMPNVPINVYVEFDGRVSVADALIRPAEGGLFRMQARCDLHHWLVNLTGGDDYDCEFTVTVHLPRFGTVGPSPRLGSIPVGNSGTILFSGQLHEVQDFPSGHGVTVWAQGPRKFIGTYLNGHYHEGRYTFSDGRHCLGPFNENGQPHGAGHRIQDGLALQQTATYHDGMIMSWSCSHDHNNDRNDPVCSSCGEARI